MTLIILAAITCYILGAILITKAAWRLHYKKEYDRVSWNVHKRRAKNRAIFIGLIWPISLPFIITCCIFYYGIVGIVHILKHPANLFSKGLVYFLLGIGICIGYIYSHLRKFVWE
jgi:hypothetical protein